MKTFKIPVSWEVSAEIDVEAETLEEAIRIFDEKENGDEDYKLPTENEYIDGTFGRENEEFCKLVNEE